MKCEYREISLSNQQGFTLIEVLIVIAIFSIGILGAMTMQTSAVGTNATTRKSTLAVEYATDTMERLMQINASQDDNYLVDDDDNGSIDDANEAVDLNSDGFDNDGNNIVDDETVWHHLPEFAQGNGHTRGAAGSAWLPEDAYYDSIFNLTWDITDIDCDGVAPDDAKRIDMTVTWDNGQKTMQFTNIRTNIF